MCELESIKLIRTIQSHISDVVFVGGFSEHIQGYKVGFSDIDLCILPKDLEKLRRMLGFLKESDISKFGSPFLISKFFFCTRDVVVDVYLQSELPEYNIVDGIKVSTIEDLINTRKYSLKYGQFRDDFQKEKLKNNLERLLKIYNEQNSKYR